MLDISMLTTYISIVIKGFADKETEKIFNGQHSRKFPVEIQRRAKMRLDRIHAATNLDDLRVPPSHQLEKLSRNRKGQHSIRINDQWRICFIRRGDAYNVEITDYH